MSTTTARAQSFIQFPVDFMGPFMALLPLLKKDKPDNDSPMACVIPAAMLTLLSVFLFFFRPSRYSENQIQVVKSFMNIWLCFLLSPFGALVYRGEKFAWAEYPWNTWIPFIGAFTVVSVLVSSNFCKSFI